MTGSKTLATTYYEIVDSRGATDVASLFAEDAVYSRPGYRSLVGRESILNFYRQERVIATGAHRINSMICSGERVAVQGVFTGNLKDGTSVSIGFSDFFEFRNELIVERRTYFDVPAV
jgi:ketosteroid isomerase-like protein